MELRFDISAEDAAHRDRVLDRAAAVFARDRRRFDRLHHSMNLTACHANGCPLDFARMAVADDFNLMHDVYGIDRHIDRETGKLGEMFRPRFASRKAA